MSRVCYTWPREGNLAFISYRYCCLKETKQSFGINVFGWDKCSHIEHMCAFFFSFPTEKTCSVQMPDMRVCVCVYWHHLCMHSIQGCAVAVRCKLQWNSMGHGHAVIERLLQSCRMFFDLCISTCTGELCLKGTEESLPFYLSFVVLSGFVSCNSMKHSLLVAAFNFWHHILLLVSDLRKPYSSMCEVYCFYSYTW